MKIEYTFPSRILVHVVSHGLFPNRQTLPTTPTDPTVYRNQSLHPIRIKIRLSRPFLIPFRRPSYILTISTSRSSSHALHCDQIIFHINKHIHNHYQPMITQLSCIEKDSHILLLLFASHIYHIIIHLRLYHNPVEPSHPTEEY